MNSGRATGVTLDVEIERVQRALDRRELALSALRARGACCPACFYGSRTYTDLADKQDRAVAWLRILQEKRGLTPNVNETASPTPVPHTAGEPQVEERQAKFLIASLLRDLRPVGRKDAILIGGFVSTKVARRYPVPNYGIGVEAALFIADWLSTRALGPETEHLHKALAEWRAAERGAPVLRATTATPIPPSATGDR